jgi:hypothetical protein
MAHATLASSLAWTTRNVMFHDATERARAEHLLTRHIDHAVTTIVQCLPEANVYLSGSLARGEPAFRHVGDHLAGLQSDLDFVLVGEVTATRLKAVEHQLNASFPGFRDTLYAFTPEQVPRLRSASARDLRLGLCRPLHEICRLEPLDPFPIDPTHALEILVYQLVAALADRHEDAHSNETRRDVGGVWHSDRPYRLHKVAVEALRVATSALRVPFSEALTFRAVYEHRGGPAFRAIAPEARIVALLSERERWTGGTVGWSEALGLMVHRAVAVTLERPRAEPLDALEDIAARVYDLNRPMHTYAVAALTAFYLAFPRFHHELRGLETMLLARLSDSWPVPTDAGSLAAAVVALRWEYVRRLMTLKDSGVALWSKAGGDGD